MKTQEWQELLEGQPFSDDLAERVIEIIRLGETNNVDTQDILIAVEIEAEVILNNRLVEKTPSLKLGFDLLKGCLV